MVERVHYETLPQIAGPYVHATKHNQTLYISGLTAFGTEAQQCDLLEQCEEVLNQIAAILEAEQRTVADIIKVTVFVTDITALPSIRESLFNFYNGFLPACSLVEVSKLINPDLKVEIEAVVAL